MSIMTIKDVKQVQTALSQAGLDYDKASLNIFLPIKNGGIV